MRLLRIEMKWFTCFFAATLFAATPSNPSDPSLFCYPSLFPAVPCVEPSCGPCGLFWTTDVSLLVWQAREEGLNFALKNEPLPITANINVNGDLVGVDFKWEPAVKIDVGATFAAQAWDTQLRWTYFHTHSSRTLHADSPSLIPLWAFPNANIATQFLYGTARSAFELNFNAFDIEMGYHPFLSPALSIRFNAGLKVASIDQDFTVTYSNGFNENTTQLVTAKAALTNKSIGAGPRISFDSKWRLSQGFALLTSLAGSLPLWHYRITRTDTDQGINGGTPNAIEAFTKERFWTFRSILEASLGLGWDTCFGCRHQFPVGVAAYYELQYFAEQNMMAMLVNPGISNQAFYPRGDLHFHGATLTFHFGF